MKKDDQRLNQLFQELQQACQAEAIEAIQEEIWTIWLTHPDSEVDALMILGCDEMEISDHKMAVRTFTEMIKRVPDFPEAWNKRATVYYLQGCFKRSIADIEQTLALEPRHFGALSGRANIFREIGDFASALRDLLNLKRLVPHLQGLDEQIQDTYCKMKSGK